MSVLPEHRRNALLRDYVPGEEPTGLEGYDDAVKRFKFQEKWNIKAARALLKASPASTPQKAHKFSKSVNVPRINVEDATPPSPVERFWNRENGNGSGGGGVEGRNGRIHSRYHSM
jgi:hypothetical protein